MEPVAIGKPERTLFRVAIERLGCPDARRPWSATARRRTSKGVAPPGCSPIWLDPEDDEPKPDSADLKVRDLAELHQLWRQAAKPPAAAVPVKRSEPTSG